eukprot:TRINITY_DN1091_c0_g1_i2.p1 TRINITY_DN1091_c0_g1~~TRINITY_DN1091_c0_g1_i2.p1  ORF type:complete len:254 (-),score=51.44 TRINITY_DN1091_c0_g1_i2:428-1189(-)
MASTSGRLSGRVAIVTGGSRGIGRETVLTLASAGAKVVVVYQGNEKAAAEVVAKVGEGKAVAVKADVSRSEDVKAMFDKAEEAFGKVHILVNNAGVGLGDYPTLAKTSDEDWDRVQATNTRGTFLATKEAVSRLVTGGGGRIINITTSLVALLLPGYSAYIASKAAVEAFTKVVAKELKGKRITANCVAPGPVATELFFQGKDDASVDRFVQSTPLERLGEPKDIAQLVLFVASDDAEWVNGQVIRANGGIAA